jgi:hypothetical protein
LLTYWHGEREARFAPEGDLILDLSWWLRTRSLLKGSAKDVQKLSIESLTDHSMDRYIELARKQLAAKKAETPGQPAAKG